MLKKCFIILQFGSPHEWTQQYIDHIQHLEKYGWYWKIFTPNKFESKGNVEIVSMTIEQFNELTEKKLGTNPKLFITTKGIPSFHVSDFFVMCGAIFEDYLKDYEFWGTIGLDCVVGRLDHFVSDEELADCDVWTDDIGMFNANFALWKNVPSVNNLFKHIHDLNKAICQPPCAGCTGISSDHALWATDERYMTEILNYVQDKGIRYKHPKYYLIHGHDRLEIHQPHAKLTIKDDGSLWELIADIKLSIIAGGSFRHAFFGREIAYYHFSNTKEWPL